MIFPPQCILIWKKYSMQKVHFWKLSQSNFCVKTLYTCFTFSPWAESYRLTHPDLDLDRDQDLERECRDPSFERAGERAGERLADFPEPRGLKLLEEERDSWMNKINASYYHRYGDNWTHFLKQWLKILNTFFFIKNTVFVNYNKRLMLV